MTEHGEAEPKLSFLNLLIPFITENLTKLPFSNESGDPYIGIQGSGFQNIAVPSTFFEEWVTSLSYRKFDKVPSDGQIKQLASLLRSQSRDRRQKLWLRVAPGAGIILYDLNDAKGQIAEIGPDGWKIYVGDAPHSFKRRRIQEAQVKPIKNGALDCLDPFLPIAEENQKRLLKVCVVSGFVPDIPHPIIIFWGPPGYWKSTSQKLMKRIIDPSTPEVSELHINSKELNQILDHNYLSIFDNTSEIRKYQSNILCKAITGAGTIDRSLYTDDDDFARSYKHLVMINGITDPIEEPDLGDRSLTFQLDRKISKPRTEERVFADFDSVRASILGGCFDVLSTAMRLKAEASEPHQPLTRLADFEEWGCYISEAMGWKRQEFLAALKDNFEKQREDLVEQNACLQAVLLLLEEEKEAVGSEEGYVRTPTELLRELRKKATENEFDMRSRRWPKASNVLSGRLRETRSLLAEDGIGIEFGRQGQRRWIRFTRTPQKDGNQSSLSSHRHSTPETRLGLSDDVSRSDDAEPSLSKSSSPLPTPKSAVSDGSDGNDDDFRDLLIPYLRTSWSGGPGTLLDLHLQSAYNFSAASAKSLREQLQRDGVLICDPEGKLRWN